LEFVICRDRHLSTASFGLRERRRPMDRLPKIVHANIERYQRLLGAAELDPSARETLMKLLAEEKAKLAPPVRKATS